MMPIGAHVENIVTIIAAAAVILGLYAMGAGGWAGAGALLLFNINYPKSKT